MTRGLKNSRSTVADIALLLFIHSKPTTKRPDGHPYVTLILSEVHRNTQIYTNIHNAKEYKRKEKQTKKTLKNTKNNTNCSIQSKQKNTSTISVSDDRTAQSEGAETTSFIH